ncbi:DUF6082 family protein [Streptomyces sp. NPDC050264]|uniref:DUF6082 family protein n=1 Tax=Streptomyces sp. NPDC050264 TaxID=3155038 RepID=UPI00341889D3
MATLTSPLRGMGSRLRAGFGRRRRRDELLERLVEEMSRANVLRQHSLFLDQLDRAIDDPDLAAALSTLPDLSDRERRLMLWVNREYAVLLLAHRVGAFCWDELIGHLRVLCRNEIFQLYWTRTVDHRRSLAPDTLDARVRDALNSIIEELATDPEEWWVVGPDTSAD